MFTVLTLFFAFPFLIVSEIGLCGKDRKKNPHILTPSFNQILILLFFLPHILYVQQGDDTELLLSPGCSLKCTLPITMILLEFKLVLPLHKKKKSALQGLKVLPIQKRQTLSIILFSNLVHQYHTYERWLAIGSNVYGSFKYISQQTPNEKLLTLMISKRRLSKICNLF